MWAICLKDLRQYLSNLTAYIAIVVFLVVNGLFLFVFPDTNLFDAGYATLEPFFDRAPLILLLLIPAITMRSFADEFKGGNYEILATSPLSRRDIVLGKFLAAWIIVLLALLLTLVYVITIRLMSDSGMDTGGILGSYLGLVLLSGAFTGIGVCCSSFTANPVVAFLLSAFACFIIYNGFTALSGLSVFEAGADYYIEMLGIEFHYRSISRGVIDSRDVVYFLSVIVLVLFIAYSNLRKR